EHLSLVKKGTWNWLQVKGGITVSHVREVLGPAAERIDIAKTDADRPVSHRMSLMAYSAWKRGIMSEGQLAELLRMPRIEVRTLIDQIELEESVTDDLLKLPG